MSKLLFLLYFWSNKCNLVSIRDYPFKTEKPNQPQTLVLQ